MNVLFTELFKNYSHLIKTKILTGLSPLQKKVALVAVAYFGCAAVGFFFYHCYFLSIHLLRKHRFYVYQHKRQHDIQQKLEKNRRAAQEQQAKERSKGFILPLGDIPESFALFIPYWGNTARSIDAHLKNVDCKQVGIASCEGAKNGMDNADIAGQFAFKIHHQIFHAEVFGIFDGYRDVRAALFVKEHLAEYLKKALEEQNLFTLTDADIENALKKAFIQLDADFTGNEGTAVIVAFTLNGKIWIANAGNSRALLVNNEGAVIQASEDADPKIERYKKTIEKLGGTVFLNRINGSLDVARSIGHQQVVGKSGQRCVSPKPKITCYSLAELQEGYLVLACHGLYKVASSHEVGKAIKQMADQGETPEKMAKRLIYAALLKNTQDNVSVMVVKL
jgi:serine/threonine protein phosphatase PrpC